MLQWLRRLGSLLSLIALLVMAGRIYDGYNAVVNKFFAYATFGGFSFNSREVKIFHLLHHEWPLEGSQ